MYYASDINEEELQLICLYFKQNNIKHSAFTFDLSNSDLSILPKTDLVLLFKVLDIIEKKGHKRAEKIITSIKAKNILISFPTHKLSGKKMTNPKRLWLHQLLTRNNLKFTTFYSSNEIFYLVEKH